MPYYSKGVQNDRTITEKQEITACYDAHSIVEGLAPEAEEFLHDEDWRLKKSELAGCVLAVLLRRGGGCSSRRPMRTST